MRVKKTTYIVKSPLGSYAIDIVVLSGAKRRKTVRVISKKR